MFNVQDKKTPMPEQDPEVRNSNFEEVAMGYTAEMAINEAKRCVQCRKPRCVMGCPVNIKIPAFIAKVAEGDFEAAYNIINRTNTLSAISGRVCPQETQCESRCARGIKGEPVAIGRLERFVSDWYRDNVNKMPEKVPSNGNKIAVVGSGPSGLSCASELAKRGYEVTIFEALHTPGGVLVYGIPEFRLPKVIVANEIEKLKNQGVEIMTNMVIGRVLSIDELFEMDYKAVYIASGAGLPIFLRIPGASLNEVSSANEYLTRINLMKAYRDESDTPIMSGRIVIIVGGGNVAMDAARSAKRLGASKVYVLYHRGEAEMTARLDEQLHAKEEGIIFVTRADPVEILGDADGSVCAVRCIRTLSGEPDKTGRRHPVPVPGSEFLMKADSVILCLGTTPNSLICKTTPGLEATKKGLLVVDDTGMTSRENVFAGGDAVTGSATVIMAMGAGKKAAEAIDIKLRMKQGLC
ncbi:MAG: NADPH-dependent glutamate synthase [Oscillospiraceae bacterium]|nr:NADPH-dependent glutamate synthase [Oscillospiraceae bacterium]